MLLFNPIIKFSSALFHLAVMKADGSNYNYNLECTQQSYYSMERHTRHKQQSRGMPLVTSTP